MRAVGPDGRPPAVVGVCIPGGLGWGAHARWACEVRERLYLGVSFPLRRLLTGVHRQGLRAHGCALTPAA